MTDLFIHHKIIDPNSNLNDEEYSDESSGISDIFDY